MTATDELRRLLDERGIEWWPMRDDESGYREDRDTEFLVCGCKHVAHEWGCRLQVDMLTPAKAVDATLGRSEESFNAGFKTGVQATLQQLYGLLHDYPTLDEIEAWADRQWEEEL